MSIIAAGVAICLGLTLNFMCETAIGLLAFWFEDTVPFFWIYQKIMLTVGGTMLPLEFFPVWLAAIARLLPFAAAIYVPARLFVAFSWEGFFGLVALQGVWLALLGIGLALLFDHASRHVQVHGG
jgi:ABC-2 type transport system permease protein